MDLIRIHVLPPSRTKSSAGTPSQDLVGKLVITTPAARIVKCRTTDTSPWEVFLRPDRAARLSIHYHAPRRKQ